MRRSQVNAVLDETCRLLAPRGAWVQHEVGTAANGVVLGTFDDIERFRHVGMKRMCLRSAIYMASYRRTRTPERAKVLVDQVIRIVQGTIWKRTRGERYWRADIAFNNGENRRKGEIIELVRRAKRCR